MKSKFTILLMACLSLFACTKKKLGSEAYLKYVEDKNNGLQVSKDIKDIRYSVQYKPAQYILLKERVAESNANDLAGMQYYTLQYSLVDKSKDIMRAHIEKQNEYYERVNYFSFGLQNDIYVVEDKDTLDCKLFNYVRSYGLSPMADFVLGFNETPGKETSDKTFVIEDNIFGGGIIKLKINQEDILNIPELTKK